MLDQQGKTSLPEDSREPTRQHENTLKNGLNSRLTRHLRFAQKSRLENLVEPEATASAPNPREAGGWTKWSSLCQPLSMRQSRSALIRHGNMFFCTNTDWRPQTYFLRGNQGLVPEAERLVLSRRSSTTPSTLVLGWTMIKYYRVQTDCTTIALASSQGEASAAISARGTISLSLASGSWELASGLAVVRKGL